MSKYKFHVVYRTVHIDTGREYVGCHSTNTVEDGYIGSGWALKDAIKEHGRDRFKRDVLAVYDTRREALEHEARIVTEAYCSRSDTFNIIPGATLGRAGKVNGCFGKIAHNSKAVRATHTDGTTILASSLEDLGKRINIARQNVRKLLQTGRTGRRGWRVEAA